MSTSLTKADYVLLEQINSSLKKLRGKPSVIRLAIFDAIFQVAETNLTWRNVPGDIGWNTVYRQYNRWNKLGLWEAILAHPSASVLLKQKVTQVVKLQTRKKYVKH